MTLPLDPASVSPSPPLRTAPPIPPGIARALDANLNRLLEGLRVAEDYARFVLDRRHLVERCKRLRHAASSWVEPVIEPVRWSARDVGGDVGTQLTGAREHERLNGWAVVAANLQRAKEACRVLEEFSKLCRPEIAPPLEKLRYEIYELEQHFHWAATPHDRLQTAQIYVLVDAGRSPADFAARIRALVESAPSRTETGGKDAAVDVLQLRDKHVDDRLLVARAEQLRELTAGTRVLMIVNDRPDIASIVSADGVHVGQTELRAQQVRSLVGPEMLLGISTHSVAQAVEAAADGADYIGIGPVFSSQTKNFDEFVGPALVAAVQSAVAIPGFAIGGIGPTNVGQLTAIGCQRIAVSQAVWGAADPCEAAEQLRAALSPLTVSARPEV